RARFRREVEALARMHHPGIVSVFAGGEEDGAPYLAMEWIEGASLQEIAAELRGRDPAGLQAADLERAVRAVVERRRLDGAGSVGGARSESSPGEAARRLFQGPWVAAALRVARDVAEALAH